MPNIVLENPKASITIFAGFVTTIVLWLLNIIWGITVPSPVEYAIAGVFISLISYWSRISKKDAKVIEVTTPKQKEAIIENAERTI
jgi:hypothetical protein